MGRARGASSLQDWRMQRSALLAVLLAACATGGPSRSPPKEDAAVARARAEVAWLADAARGGRGVGTEGGDEAARWIAARFEEAGLAPAYDEGYLQWLEAPYRATLKAGNTLRLGSAALTVEQDFIPFGFSDDGTVEAEVVYAGHGITAPDLRHDDYAGLDVKGQDRGRRAGLPSRGAIPPRRSGTRATTASRSGATRRSTRATTARRRVARRSRRVGHTHGPDDAPALARPGVVARRRPRRARDRRRARPGGPRRPRPRGAGEGGRPGPRGRPSRSAAASRWRCSTSARGPRTSSRSCPGAIRRSPASAS